MIALRQDWSDDVQALLESLALQGTAILPLLDLPDRLGIAGPELMAIIAEARALDLVMLWSDAPCGQALMMTSRAADHLQLELWAPARHNLATKTGCRSVCWVPRGEAPDERSTPSCRIHGETTAADVWDDENLDLGIHDQADPEAISAEALMIQAEEAARKRGLEREAALLRWSPLLVLGVRQAWPIQPDPDGGCGVCHGRRLDHNVYCLWCQRSGIDALLPKVPRTIARHAYRPGRLPGGKGGAPVPKVVKAAETKPKKKRRTKLSYAELMTQTPAPKSAWRAELDAMKAAAKGK